MDQSTLYLLSGLVVLFAGFVHGAVGLGFPMIATPLLALLTDVKTAVLITLIPTTFVNTISIITAGHWKSALKKYGLLAVIAMLGSMIGTHILLPADSGLFKGLLALIILLYIFVDRFQLDYAWLLKWPTIAMVVFGIFAGLMGGLTNVMAPVLIIYFLAINHKPEDTIQGSNLCFLLGKISQITVFGYAGLIDENILISSLPIVIICITALFFGIKIRQKISVAFYKRILKRLLFIIAALLIVQSFGY
jgi:uncharacterized membrane protein YfcA